MSKSNLVSTNGILSEAISTKLSRRSFLKWSAAIGATASGAGLVASGKVQKAQAVHGETAPNSIANATEWVGTHCLMCHSWCGLAVCLDADGLARKIEGTGGQPRADGDTTAANFLLKGGAGGDWVNAADKHHPAVTGDFLPYVQNRGRICAKGNSGLDTLYDPDRVKYPLKRIGDRGEGKWQKISWRQAYYEIANVYRELRGDATDCVGAAVPNARLVDNRHRLVMWAGRNETEGLADFAGTYGSPNHVEHTSLCESSRHQSTLTLFGHHFPFPDLNSHSGTGTLGDWNDSGSFGPDSDVDFMLEVGGNPTEAKIPMTSYGVRWGSRRKDGCRIVNVDVRLSNSGAYSDENLLIDPGQDGALALGILGVIFRELHIAPSSGGGTPLKDELLNGHFGESQVHAMADRRWVGLFASEESGGLDSGLTDFDGNAVPDPPAAESLESYLIGLFGAGLAGGGSLVVSPEAFASAQCGTGISAADVIYLAGACSGADMSVGGTPAAPVFDPADGAYSVPTFSNPSIEGYRGPSKHSNGYYSWKLLRTLQLICGRFRVGTGLPGIHPESGAFDFTGTSTTFGRGGISRPGGLIPNGWGANDPGVIGLWNPWGNIGSSGYGAGPGYAAGQIRNTYPHASNKWNGEFDPVSIDRWDYEKGRHKSPIGTQGIDQNLAAAVRVSLNLHPYKVGQTIDKADYIHPYGSRRIAIVDTADTAVGAAGTTVIPVGDSTGFAAGNSVTVHGAGGAGGTTTSSQNHTVASVGAGTIEVNGNGTGYTAAIGDNITTDEGTGIDPDFEVECLVLFKNGPGNTRPNIKLDQELFTAKVTEKVDRQGEYRLRHIFSVDSFMGDATRFADIVLPDTSYLERWDHKHWENMMLRGTMMVRQPVMRTDMSKDIWDPSSKELFLYDARPVTAISWELNRAIAGHLAATAPAVGPAFNDFGPASPFHDAGDEDYSAQLAAGAVGASPAEGQPWDALGLGGIGAVKDVYFRFFGIGNGVPYSTSVPTLTAAAALANPDLERFAYVRAYSNIYDANQRMGYYEDGTSLTGGVGGYRGSADTHYKMGKHNSAKTKVGDVGGGARLNILEVYNRRVSQCLDAGADLVGAFPAQMNGSGYKYNSLPIYQDVTQHTSPGYPRHLTTYKLNVHTQSRTGQNALLVEIIGACWAVMGKDGSDALGLFADGDDGSKIRSGDLVKVATKQGFVKVEAKVTDKARSGTVSISNSFGHEAKGQDPDEIGTSQGVSTVYGTSNAFGSYYVDGKLNREYTSDYPGYAGDPVDVYRVEYPATAPGRSVHPNHAINRTNDNLATGAALNYDPIGTSLGWFDSKCKVTKA